MCVCFDINRSTLTGIGVVVASSTSTSAASVVVLFCPLFLPNTYCNNF